MGRNDSHASVEIARAGVRPVTVTDTSEDYQVRDSDFELIFAPAEAATPCLAVMPPARSVDNSVYCVRILGANAATSTVSVVFDDADRVTPAASTLDTAEDYVVLWAIRGQYVILGGVFTEGLPAT